MVQTFNVRKSRVAVVATFILLTILGLGYVFWPRANSSDLKVLTEREDQRELEVEVWSPQRKIINPYTEITVVSNKKISLLDNNFASLQYLGVDYGNNYYVVRVDGVKVGETKFELTFKDQTQNEYKQEIVLTRDKFAFPAGANSIESWDDAEYIIGEIDLMVSVDKSNRLLSDYEPEDLVDLNKRYGLYTYNNAQLRIDAAAALRNMLNDLRKETGKSVTVASGYRSFETQVRIYGNWVRGMGVVEADKVSARPGHSEHQLGTTVDFVSDETDWKISPKFGDTAAGKWLAQNSGNYGFIVPYTSDESRSGGYKEESWHFRYVGNN